MTKLTSDQQKKVALLGLLFAFVLYWYFLMLLPGLDRSLASAGKKIKAAEPKIAEAKREIAAVKTLEAQAPTAGDALEALRARIPDGSPVAWFPPKIQGFFDRHGIEKTTTRQRRSLGDFGVGDLTRVEWTVDIPKVDAIALGIAIAGLETEDPTVSVVNVQIIASEDNAEFQRATLVLSSIVKK